MKNNKRNKWIMFVVCGLAWGVAGAEGEACGKSVGGAVVAAELGGVGTGEVQGAGMAVGEQGVVAVAGDLDGVVGEELGAGMAEEGQHAVVSVEGQGAGIAAEGRSVAMAEGEGKDVEAGEMEEMGEAEVVGDSVVVFRFVPGRLMFYRDLSREVRNVEAIGAVARLIERHRAELESGRAYLRVRGFCGSFGNTRANLQAAKNRSNQVKSWFISHHGMREEFYRTSNSTRAFRGSRDVVAIVGLEYAEGHGPRRDSVTPMPAGSSLAVALPDEGEIEEMEEMELAALPAPGREMGEMEEMEEMERVQVPLAVKTNLLYDLLLLPTVEVEYSFNERWSLNVEGSVAWWRIGGGVNKYYDLWIVSPEARYWFSTRDRWHGHHAGLFAGAGAYDLENGKQGYKGEYFMTGLAYGFMFPVRGCRSLHLEANIGVGYMFTEYEEYLPVDGHYVYQETGRLNYVGPLKAKFSLVWVLDLWRNKKGGRR